MAPVSPADHLLLAFFSTLFGEGELLRSHMPSSRSIRTRGGSYERKTEETKRSRIATGAPPANHLPPASHTRTRSPTLIRRSALHEGLRSLTALVVLREKVIR